MKNASRGKAIEEKWQRLAVEDNEVATTKGYLLIMTQCCSK
jgi:hypothetical protein